MYTPAVSYTYSVGGQSFEGTCIARSLENTSMSHGAAKRFTDKYPPQAQVQVLYDRADPKAAYLETRGSVGAIIFFCFGMLWIALETPFAILSVTE